MRKRKGRRAARGGARNPAIQEFFMSLYCRTSTPPRTLRLALGPQGEEGRQGKARCGHHIKRQYSTVLLIGRLW